MFVLLNFKFNVLLNEIQIKKMHKMNVKNESNMCVCHNLT